jgi:phage/plasmid-associated DNA primase
LYDDLGSREDNLQNLKTYAQPLLEFCEEHVVQEIESTMQKATIKWNETNDNLKQICNKYKGAVTLWKKYCEESNTLRNMINQTFEDMEDSIPNKTPEEIEVIGTL